MYLLASGGLSGSDLEKFGLLLCLCALAIVATVLLPLISFLIARKAGSLAAFVIGGITLILGLAVCLMGVTNGMGLTGLKEKLGIVACGFLPYGITLASLGVCELCMGFGKRRTERDQTQ